MRRVGILTFHAAHNYGSGLQAYALQQTLDQMGVENEFINFRTERQKDQYRPLTKRRGLKYLVKNFYFLLHYAARSKKYRLFEAFISDCLRTTKEEYSSDLDLEEKDFPYNCYISGSDQIWNTEPNDADMAYFLPFVKNGKRIAYAPSFGQKGHIKHKDEIASYLMQYDVLSVRDTWGQKFVAELTGRSAPVVLDPTMLLTASQWDRLIGPRIEKKKYILLYTLFATPEIIRTTKYISKQLHLPVIITTITNQYDIFSGFCVRMETGPREFLNYVKYAECVCTTSFHGTVFSILLHRPFLTIGGMEDRRIATLLGQCGLEKYSCIPGDCPDIKALFWEIPFDHADEQIQKERTDSLDFLKRSLECL